MLTTTRIESVAVACCNFQWEFVYRLKPLDDHNSRQLFYHRVFGLGNACPQPLEEPSEKILQKCGGLPLAIISIASLLASQLDKSLGQWNYVLNSLRSDLGSNPSLEGMRHILNLSYTHLPRHLKTCLLYIGMYPEDFDIRKHMLVMQWVAEGFVSGLNGRDALEIAGSYFNELVNRSMIIQLDYCTWNGVHNTRYKVHDMVLDLIVSKSTEENFLAVIQNLQTITTKQQYNARRISLQLNVSSAPRMSLLNARSLFIFGLSLHNFQLLELKFVRVLFLLKVDGGLDLTPIGNLFQLRNLVVDVNNRDSEITQLQQICGLRHLETLSIRRGLFRLPRDIVHLPALSYLRLDSGITYPNGINNMKSLHTLRFFDPSMQSVDNLRALGELQNLRQLDLWIQDQSFSTKEAHMGALLHSIEKLINCNLRCLTFESDDGHTSHYDGWNSLCLSSCHLEELDMNFSFPQIPVWVGQLSTLVSLRFFVDELRKDDIAVLAGLPVLAYLVLRASNAPDESIILSSSAVYRNLRYFSVSAAEAGLSLHFQGGAMPKIETMGLQLRVDEVKTFGVRLHGIENLPTLKRVFIRLDREYRSDMKSQKYQP